MRDKAWVAPVWAPGRWHPCHSARMGAWRWAAFLALAKTCFCCANAWLWLRYVLESAVAVCCYASAQCDLAGWELEAAAEAERANVGPTNGPL